MRDNPRDKITSYIYTRCFEKGNFTLTSGMKTNYYINMKQALLVPEGSYLISRALLKLVAEKTPEAEAVGGPALGAVPLIASMSVLSSHVEGVPSLSSFIVRKEKKQHGTTSQVESPPLPLGTKVLIVDDVVTTGGSTFRAVDAAVEMGWDICGVFTVVDRLEGGQENMHQRGLNFYPLLLVNDLDKLEDEMEERFPLCWAAVNGPAGEEYVKSVIKAWPEICEIFPTIGYSCMFLLEKLLEKQSYGIEEIRRRMIRLLKHLALDSFDKDLNMFVHKMYNEFL